MSQEMEEAVADPVTRMARVLVALMFAELVVVVLLVDYRLDAVEARVSRSGASVVRSRYGPHDGPQTGARTEQRTAAAGSAPEPEGAPQEEPARLTDEDRQAVIEELYRAERVWRRTAGVLEGLSSLRKRQMLRELDRTERARIVEATRDYAKRRVRIELAVMASDVPDMDKLREDLAEYDRVEAERIEGEFCSFLNPAEALQLVRVVVPRGQQ